MKSYNQKYLPFFLGIALCVGVFIGGKYSFKSDSQVFSSSNKYKTKLNRLIDYIEYEYVDGIDTDSIVDVTVDEILSHLDPHSTYIPKTDRQRIDENMKGEFVGIGIHFYNYRDTVVVIRTVVGGPSDKAGIKGGDRIIAVNGESVTGREWNNAEIVNKFKGEVNSALKLSILRPKTAEFFEVDINRDHVPITSIDGAYMLNNTFGYVKINRFSESTYDEFKQGLKKLISNGAVALVLDLRANPGGLLSPAKKIADEFLKEEELILITKNRGGEEQKTYASARGDFKKGEVYVLIDENTASSSEILAGALQDNDRGTIVGRRSFGKGLVQREMELGDGSAVRLTVSRYYTPTGRSIQRPFESSHEEYFMDYQKRYERGELEEVDKIEHNDALKFITPKGKVVYGGGGITPDIFVPESSDQMDTVLSYLLKSGFVNYFTFEELDKDRDQFTLVEKQKFIDHYEVPDKWVDKFKKFIQARYSQSIHLDDYTLEIKKYLKASLGGQLFDSSVYLEVINQGDGMIAKVLSKSR